MNKVLELEMGIERGDDGYELFLAGASREPLRYPVVRVELRVAVTEPLGEWGEPEPEAVEEAARLLVAAEKPPWWRRWWREWTRRAESDLEKALGAGWRTSP